MIAPPRSCQGHPKGRLAYVAKMFPRISETFVLNEIHALRHAGVPLRVYSILPAERDLRIHPEAAALLGETETLLQPTARSWPRFGALLLRSLRIAPVRTLVEIARAFLPPTPHRFRLFFRGVALADRLRRDRIVHVHAAWAHTPASVVEIASRLTRIPWSMAAHAKDIHTSDERSLARKMSSARFTLACTAHHRDLLRGIGERHAERFIPGEIHLAHHGVDCSYFSPAEDAPERREGIGPNGKPPSDSRAPILLSVGRLVPKKGMDTLLEAASRLQAMGIEFVLEIVGDGPMRASLKRGIQERGLDGVVSLRGLMVRDEVRAAMRRAACFALPCRVSSEGDRDGIPNSVAEAMAMGLPVVTTRLPSIEELVTHEETGLLVPPDDADALARALSRLLHDKAERRRLGARARAAVRERFDASRCEPERIGHLMRGMDIGRILYVSADRGVPIRGGKGASIHVRALVQEWRELGVESSIVTANAGPSGGEEPMALMREARTAPGLRRLAHVLARLGGGAPETERAWLRLLDNVTLLRAAGAVSRKWRPDLLYERYALIAVAGSFLARRLGIPHVLEVNAPLADEEERYRGLRLGRLTRFLEGWTMRRADLVVVVSPALGEHARRLGVRPERIRMLPNGVDARLFHPGRDGSTIRSRLGMDGDLVVGFSGSLRPWHGVHHLVRGFASARKAGARWKLLIVGEGGERASLEDIARMEGVADHVIFSGAVPHSEMGDYLAACDVLCAPYGPTDRFYFSPIKLAEYLASGRPVIASDVGHLRRMMNGSRAALWTDPGDEAAIARALLDLGSDPDRRSAMAREAASSVWTWHDVATATLAEAERARERLWRWPKPPSIGYVLKVFPRFSETFILNEILELERTGAPLAIFSMRAPTEPIRQPGVERVRAPVFVLSDRARSPFPLLASHLGCLFRSPLRYARTAAFARSRGNESAWSKFLHAAVLAREARRLGITHFHAHFASGPARQAKFASMLSGIPFSFTAHAKDLFWNGHAHESCRKLKHRIERASFVAAISEHNRAFLENVGAHAPPGRIVTVYNGLDLEAWPFRRPLGRPETPGPEPLVLAVGRLVEKKGFLDLLEALAILRTRGCRVRGQIAGEGPERERLETLLRERGIGEIVELLGPVPQDRLAADLYSRAHVLAQPSRVAQDGDQDGIPTVLLEAMALGLPVVATPVSGIGEAVIHEETGLLARAEDPTSLADAIVRVIADDALAARIARGARRHVESRFSLRDNARRLARRFAAEVELT